ncbi:hypothetical protein KPL47_04755 [Clostridium estertheticum]|uniref:hypothetical protein n=1 Tax=Clostridium estertheticum TaxID=238834 RepID=UPI001C0C3FD3|nr:hypothetical protein [Clostridium estertheticum]MBU3175672.1 hypothetical protein [Clostridium estertheticum]
MKNSPIIWSDYPDIDEWNKLGITHSMVYKLDMFVGCRFGLFMYSTKKIGGAVGFSQFRYNTLK